MNETLQTSVTRSFDFGIVCAKPSGVTMAAMSQTSGLCQGFAPEGLHDPPICFRSESVLHPHLAVTSTFFWTVMGMERARRIGGKKGNIGQ